MSFRTIPSIVWIMPHLIAPLDELRQLFKLRFQTFPYASINTAQRFALPAGRWVWTMLIIQKMLRRRIKSFLREESPPSGACYESPPTLTHTKCSGNEDVPRPMGQLSGSLGEGQRAHPCSGYTLKPFHRLLGVDSNH